MDAVAALANGAWLATNVPAWWRFRAALKNPERAQNLVLGNLLRHHAPSAYGRAHGFERIGHYEQFRDRVPAVEYDDLAPWVERIRHGEPKVLTTDPVTRLVPTSGSSGGRKLIPFTAGLQGEFNRAIGPWITDLTRQFPTLPFGPAYWSISPALPVGDSAASAVPIGFDDDSAYLGGFRQRLAEATFAAPSGLRRIEDIEHSRYATLLCLLRRRDLRLISVWHPSFLTLLLETMERRWAELLDDLRSGGCQGLAELRGDVSPSFRSLPQTTRAESLRHFLPTSVQKIWPHLRVVSCWGDAQAGLAYEDLRRKLPDPAFQSKGLLATEAVVSIPFRGQHPLATRSHFFEFEDPRGNIQRAHELRRGETYAVIVTTGGGLWRYRLGDLVEVDGFVAATPSLRFLGRGQSTSDLCGEKLAESFVTLAIATACQHVKIHPRFAMLAPERSENGLWSYTLFMEGSPPTILAAALDEALGENPHYAHCRRLGQLGPITICETGERAYEVFSAVWQAEGRRLGEIKPQSLSTRIDWRQHFSLRSQADP